MKSYHFDTIAVHGGWEPDPATGSRAVPVYRSTAFSFQDAQHAKRLFNLEEPGNIYTRLGNPTQEVLENRMADLEGGAAALALASGTNAVFYSIINICGTGDEVIASSSLYGGTYTMLNNILPEFGITVRFFDVLDPDQIKDLVNDKTKAVFIESIGNPGLDVPDFHQIAEAAHEKGLPLIVDNTFPTPYLLRPIEYGADIVVHSLTKWIGGHGTGIGGVVVDSGKFDWKLWRFPRFTEPDRSYHGIRWALDLGDLTPAAYLVRMRLVALRNLGGCISPDNAWMFLQGLETLHLRMSRHSENAAKTAEWLAAHDNVKWVKYPGLETSLSFRNASKYLKKGFGGMVVFGIKGGLEAGKQFISELNLFSHVANVGDAKSLAIHPATTTHSQLDEAALEKGGISQDLIRLSIGIEDFDDIIQDLDQALKKAGA
ncbi:MAG: O-acetylhomoserine aminocarboxypropyltransferase/cysteine synthase family protein [Spirochaetia bacterium]